MNRFSLKAVKALVLIGVVGGVVVGCNDVASVKAPLPAEENTPVAGVVANRNGSAMLTADEREAKKREFFAKSEVKEMSAGLEEIAQAVAVAVEDKTLRDRIYAKCMEKFDGETNVLWQQLDADANLRSKGGWSKQVDDLVGKGRKNTTIKGIGNVDAAIKKFEKVMNAPLHLFWAFPENWDKKTTPIVAFVPLDGDPGKRRSIPAFDAKGNMYDISSNGEIAKKRPIIVITSNERVKLSGESKNNTWAAQENGNYALISPVKKREGENLPQITDANGINTPNHLNIVSATIKYPHNDEIWWDGGPEFEAIVIAYTTDLNHGYKDWTIHYPIGSGVANVEQTYNVGTLKRLYYNVSAGVVLNNVNVEFWEDDGWDWIDDFIDEKWFNNSSYFPGITQSYVGTNPADASHWLRKCELVFSYQP